jgi:hypothetical protein
MKLAYGMISYLAGAAASVAIIADTVLLLVGPDKTPVAVVKAETSGAAPAEPIAVASDIAAAPADDLNRVPTWIAPTPEYPAATPNNAEQAKKQARSRKAESRHSDWRLRERHQNFESPYGALGFATDPRARRNQAYEEPIQFREKTEPR